MGSLSLLLSVLEEAICALSLYSMPRVLPIDLPPQTAPHPTISLRLAPDTVNSLSARFGPK